MKPSTLLALALLLCTALPALAALPPAAEAQRRYQSMLEGKALRQNASEILHIRIFTVERMVRSFDTPTREQILSSYQDTMVLYEIRITAGVRQVERSRTGLKPGDLISIVYHVASSPPLVGPPSDTLEELAPLQDTWAHLDFDQSRQAYAPVAGYWSFTDLEEFELMLQDARYEYQQFQQP